MQGTADAVIILKLCIHLLVLLPSRIWLYGISTFGTQVLPLNTIVLPWPDHLKHLNLGFLICKMKVIIT